MVHSHRRLLYFPFSNTYLNRHLQTLRKVPMCFLVFFCIWWQVYRRKQAYSCIHWNDYLLIRIAIISRCRNFYLSEQISSKLRIFLAFLALTLVENIPKGQEKILQNPLKIQLFYSKTTVFLTFSQ
jgi:hypothetical protein